MLGRGKQPLLFNANKNRALIKALCSYQVLSHPRKILIPGLNYKVIIMKKLILRIHYSQT